MPEWKKNHGMKLFSSAADARKRSAKCAIAHEQADDKADVVLLNVYTPCNYDFVRCGSVCCCCIRLMISSGSAKRPAMCFEKIWPPSTLIS